MAFRCWCARVAAVAVVAAVGVFPVAQTAQAGESVAGPESVRSDTVTGIKGPYLLVNYFTGKCVDIPGSGPGKPNGPLIQYSCISSSSDNQRFYFLETEYSINGRPLVAIMNYKDLLCLDVPGSGTVAPGTYVTEGSCNANMSDNQLYWWKPVTAPSGAPAFMLVNVANQMCLDIVGYRNPANGVRYTLWPCSMADDHIWVYIGV